MLPQTVLLLQFGNRGNLLSGQEIGEEGGEPRQDNYWLFSTGYARHLMSCWEKTLLEMPTLQLPVFHDQFRRSKLSVMSSFTTEDWILTFLQPHNGLSRDQLKSYNEVRRSPDLARLLATGSSIIILSTARLWLDFLLYSQRTREKDLAKFFKLEPSPK